MDSDWARFAKALVLRFERDQSEPWRARGLDIARDFLVACTSDVTVDQARTLLLRAGELPADRIEADSTRSVIYKWGFDVFREALCSEAPARARLIAEPHGGLAILTGPTEPPKKSWLKLQEFEPMRKYPAAQWWDAMVLDGGAVGLPEPLVFVLGDPQPEHLERLVEMANVAAMKQVAWLFPDLTRELLRKRR